MTTFTISQLPNAPTPLSGLEKLAVDYPIGGGSYATGQIASSDIKTYISTAPLPTINATSAVLTSATVTNLTVNEVYAVDITASGNLSVAGNAVFSSTEWIASSNWTKLALATPAVTPLTRIGSDSSGSYYTTNAILRTQWNSDTTASKAFAYIQNNSTGRHEFRTANVAYLSPTITWTTSTTIDESGLQAIAIGSITPGSGAFTSLTAGATSLGLTTAASLNNTPIGAVTPSTAAFTTVTAASLNNTIIGNVTPAAATFTTTNSTNVLVNANTSVRNLTVGNGEVSIVANQGGGGYINVHDYQGNNGTNYSLTLRGLGSLGTVGVNLAALNVQSLQTNFSGNILPTSNVSYTLGSSTAWWGSIYGTASHALYADLAEKYESDEDYEPGTVVVFGVETEVTISSQANDTRVAGVVSTNPAYLMNGAANGVAVALQGRVPCKVTGDVRRGDLIVTSSIPGVGMTNNDPKIGTVIGKALASHTGDQIGMIEVVVGRV